MSRSDVYFIGYQTDWVRDPSPLRICEKGRQLGMSYGDSYDSVKKAAIKNGRDVWVMSRDEVQAKQYIRYCKRWANVLGYAAEDHGEQIFSTVDGKSVKVQVLTFASGASIYALSSNPDAIVGKTGHVKLDEFALHKDQRTLYSVAKPVTQWGGTLSIISTHRGAGTVFNELIKDIRERGNPMGWSLHSIPVQKAVDQGLVEKINAASGRNETREGWLARQRAECIDEEQWLQEYCCIPADESSAFITYEMIAGCEDDSARKNFEYVQAKTDGTFYLGFDVARTTHLSVIDVEEKVGDVYWERMRIELRGKSFAEQEFEFNRLMALPQVKRGCIDATGLGMQLAENSVNKWGSRAEAIRFSGPVKEELAFPLRSAHEDRTLRYAKDDALRADLRGIKKETTVAGNIRFVGEAADSHCDRFWAKALALYAGGGYSASGPILVAPCRHNELVALRRNRTLEG